MTVASGEESLHFLFEAQAERTPGRPALAFAGHRLSYAELNGRANQIAHFLRQRGIGPDSSVALCLERSADTIIALLGVLKAGGAYVPLLPDSPKARLAHQLADAQAPVLITHEKLLSALPEYPGEVLCLDRDAARLAGHGRTNPERVNRPQDLAYVIFTSGSTGAPKGVAIQHDSLVNYTTFICDKLRLAEHDEKGGLVFATVSTIAADLGNTCIFPALASGGCLHVISHEMAMDGDAFARYCRQDPIDVLKITPSHLAALLAFEDGRDILPRRYLITGGEASTWKLVEKVRSMAELSWINHYGPTETTIGSLTFDVDGNEWMSAVSTTVPIGRPIANTRVYVLDADGQPVGLGTPGELFIGGRGVARGYLRQPQLTAERFVRDPFVDDGQARMYRTGDRVRVLPDGAIEFLGRVDHQIKLRGFRVELGEIEAALRQHPEVRQAVVVAREHHRDELRVYAYLVPRATPGPSANELRRFLQGTLPEHMIPSAFMLLDALPLTPNGKVDRASLPAPLEEAGPDQAKGRTLAQPIPDELEAQISAIWKDVLGLKSVRVSDNFFEIGGHSLAALHMLARVERKIGRKVPHAVLFRDPTVAGLAATLRGEESDFASLIPIQPGGSRPPLFCVHGGGGHVYYYRDLARRLGPDQPLYGLQARHVDGKLPTQYTVEEMAEFYLHEIQMVQPRGPYYLCGASFGGKVALEMGRTLRERGEEVAMVAMFDTWGPGYPSYRPNLGPLERSAFWIYRRLEHHLGSVWMLEPHRRMAYIREKRRFAAEEVRQSIANLLNSWSRWRRRLAGKEVTKELEHSEGFIRRASSAYRPRPYSGRVHLFRSVQPLGIVPDPLLGWGGVLSDVHVHDVPGLHSACVVEPRVRFLVGKLEPILERARAESSPSRAVARAAG